MVGPVVDSQPLCYVRSFITPNSTYCYNLLRRGPLRVDVHLELALVVLDVALGLLGVVASGGADDRVDLALDAVSDALGVALSLCGLLVSIVLYIFSCVPSFPPPPGRAAVCLAS